MTTPHWPDPADYPGPDATDGPTAGLRCPTCGRAPRLSTVPAERSPPCPAEAEVSCCKHYAHGAADDTETAAARAAGRWVRLFPVADAGADVDPEPAT